MSARCVRAVGRWKTVWDRGARLELLAPAQSGSSGDVRVGIVVLGNARAKIVLACLCAGGFVLFVCLFIPLEPLLLSRPVYNIGEAGLIALVAAAVVMAGCLLSVNPRRAVALVFGLVVSAALRVAGTGVVLSLAIYNPTALLRPVAVIAVLIATGGFFLARYLGRPGGDKKSAPWLDS